MIREKSLSCIDMGTFAFVCLSPSVRRFTVDFMWQLEEFVSLF
jgi:hypothetical protein